MIKKRIMAAVIALLLIVNVSPMSLVAYAESDMGTEEVTLSASPDTLTCIITFDMCGHGESIEAVEAEAGACIDKPNDPEAEGFIFDGWYADQEHTSVWNFETDTVNENITLFAKWSEAEQASEDSSAEQETAEAACPAFGQSRTVNGVTVHVSAPEGVFPMNASLSVELVPVEAQPQVDAAVETERESGRNVAVSYTFDIKVLDPDGNELQPGEGQSVNVSFTLTEVANENLTTEVYHVSESEEGGSLSAEVMKVETNEATATVTTEGFSYYTVEFTYGDKQYVLSSEDSPVELCIILDTVGLTGTINDVSVSDESLLGIVRADDADTWLLYTLKPFETEERLKTVIDGVEYVIILTDAIIPDGGSGSNNRTFARSADLATVTIDPSKLTKEFVNLSKSTFSSGITYSNGKVTADLGSVDLDYEKVFDGFTIVFSDAVIMSDGSREDLIFSVGSITVAGRDNKINPAWEIWPHNETILLLNLDYNQGNSYPSITAQGSATYTMGSKEYGYNQGFRMDDACLKIEGKDSTHSYSLDTYFYTVRGLNINRRPDTGSFGHLHGASSNYSYTEAAQIKAGSADGNIYVMENYATYMDLYDGNTLVAKTSSGGNNYYENGFAVLGLAQNGVNATFWQNAPRTTMSNGELMTTDFFLLPDEITHNITSSSGYYGMIEVWKNGQLGTTGDGNWLYGGRYVPGEVDEKRMYDVPNGKEVTYKLTPEEGYIINKLLIDGVEMQPTNVVYKSTGEVDYYTYAFPAGGNTESDHTIHVTWQPAVTLEFEKYWDDDNDALKLRPNSIDITLSPWPTQTTDGSGNLVHGIHRNDLTSTDADYTLTSSDTFHEILVISPFLSGGVIRDFNDRNTRSLINDARYMLITREMSLGRLKPEDVSHFQIYTMRDAVIDGETAISDEAQEIQKQDIHAKIYMIRKYSSSDLYLGSLNASHNAVYGNIEFMIRLRSKRRYLDLDKLAASLFGTEKDGSDNPFQEVTLQTAIVEEEDEPTKALDAVVKEINRSNPSAVVHPEDEEYYSASIHFEACDTKGYQISIRPLLSRRTEEFSRDVLFTRLTITQLSEFYVIAVSDREQTVAIELHRLLKRFV